MTSLKAWPVQGQPRLVSLVPKSLVPKQAFSVGKIILHGIHCRIEDNFGGIRAVFGPVDFVARPLRVGITSQNKGEKILLHLALLVKRCQYKHIETPRDDIQQWQGQPRYYRRL